MDFSSNIDNINISSYLEPNPASKRTRWLITYADMITLLLTFFILSLVIAGEIEQNIYDEIDKLLNQSYLQIKNYITTNKLHNEMKVKRETKGVHITISSGALFESGQADIKQQLFPALDQIGRAISNTEVFQSRERSNLSTFYKALNKMNKKVIVEVRIEGHTDDIPIHTERFPSNWELSYARALSVLNFLAGSSKLPEKIFTASGYSKYRPVVPNTNDTNRAKNRRVEIYIDAELAEKE